jgi:thiol-disulfide isomerase/thioredoxin
MLIELEEDNFQTLLNENETVVVQYTAAWCGNCRVMKPKFKRFAGENEQVAFVLIDAEKFPEARKFASVNNLPTFATFKNAVLVNQVQTNKEDLLKNLINEVTAN